MFQFFTIERSDSNLDHLPSFDVLKHDLVMDDKMRYKISGTTNKRHIESTKYQRNMFPAGLHPWVVSSGKLW